VLDSVNVFHRGYVPGDFERARFDGLGGIGGVAPAGRGEIVSAGALVGRDGIGGGEEYTSSSFISSIPLMELMSRLLMLMKW